MKLILKIVLISVIMVSSANLFAENMAMNQQTANKEFQTANEFYQNKQFQDAIDTYTNIINAGYVSDDIFYNLGNCFYKIEEYPSAILNYEKAMTINPRNDDIALNLKLANAQIVDKIQPLPEFFLTKWYKSISKSANSSGWGIATLVWIWIGLILILLFVFIKSPMIKRATFALSILSILLAIASYIMANDIKKSEEVDLDAIIFTESVFIKSSPDSESKNLFMLHSGTKVSIEDEVSDWYKIKIADGNDGWIGKDALELIKI